MSSHLEWFAMSFLRYDKRCPIVIRERTPRPGFGFPDVLGVTQRRELLEIEIKRSMADFRANAKKFHVATHVTLTLKGVGNPYFPRLFWFLVPHSLADRAAAELPSYAGLLAGPSPDDVQQLRSVVPARPNPEHQPLSIKHCLSLGRCMANQIMSYERRLYLNSSRAELRTRPDFEI